MRRRTRIAGKRLILNKICGLKRHNHGKWGNRVLEPLYNEVSEQTIFIINEHYNMLVDNDKNKPMTGEILSIKKSKKNLYIKRHIQKGQIMFCSQYVLKLFHKQP